MKYAQMSRDILRGEGCAMEKFTRVPSPSLPTAATAARKSGRAMRYCLSQSWWRRLRGFRRKDSVAALTTTALYLCRC
jgi:hypothetical protein